MFDISLTSIFLPPAPQFLSLSKTNKNILRTTKLGALCEAQESAFFLKFTNFFLKFADSRRMADIFVFKLVCIFHIF